MEEVWAGCCIAQAHEKHMLASDGTDRIKLPHGAMFLVGMSHSASQ